jgi:hypothetical protein
MNGGPLGSTPCWPSQANSAGKDASTAARIPVLTCGAYTPKRQDGGYARTGTASDAIASISSEARSNSSSESTGVPSKGRSR